MIIRKMMMMVRIKYIGEKISGGHLYVITRLRQCRASHKEFNAVFGEFDEREEIGNNRVQSR